MDREHRYDIAISIMHTARLSNNINSTYANHDANRQVQNFTRLDNDVGMTICVSRLGASIERQTNRLNNIQNYITPEHLVL